MGYVLVLDISLWGFFCVQNPTFPSLRSKLMNQEAGEQATLKRAPETENEGANGEPPVKRLKTVGEGDVAQGMLFAIVLTQQEPIVPTVNTSVPSAVPSETKSETPKLATTKANPRDVQEVINEAYLTKLDLASLTAQHKSKQPVAHTVLPDFLNVDFVKELIEALNNEGWDTQKSDVCLFEQTADLKGSTQVMLVLYPIYIS